MLLLAPKRVIDVFLSRDRCLFIWFFVVVVVVVVVGCRRCGQVVCTICSPSGDNISGDGISTKVKLLDKRIPLPELGTLRKKCVVTMRCSFIVNPIRIFKLYLCNVLFFDCLLLDV